MTNILSVVVLLVTGLDHRLLVRRRARSRSSAAIGLLLLFGYAFSWVFALLGLLVSSPESANSVGFIAVFPLTFISSAFVPVDSMPAGLQWFAEINPFTIVVDAMRALWLGAPAGNSVWGAVVWSLVILAVFAPLAVARYRRAAGQLTPPRRRQLGRGRRGAALDFLAQRLDPRQRGAVGLVDAVEARRRPRPDEGPVEVADQAVQQRAVGRAAVEQRVLDVGRAGRGR